MVVQRFSYLVVANREYRVFGDVFGRFDRFVSIFIAIPVLDVLDVPPFSNMAYNVVNGIFMSHLCGFV